MEQNKCRKCGTEINQKQQRGPKKKTCDACRTIKKAEYYAAWYAKNGRNRYGGYSVHIMEWKRQNPEKVAAHKIVAAALKGGRIQTPGKCSECGKISNYLDAHHDDYKKPLNIRWLCVSCHRKEHNKNKLK